jgi:hypothetical protein
MARKRVLTTQEDLMPEEDIDGERLKRPARKKKGQHSYIGSTSKPGGTHVRYDAERHSVVQR